MSEIFKKLNRFRSSNMFFFVGWIFAVTLISFSLKKIFSVDPSTYDFFTSILSVLTGFLLTYDFGNVLSRRRNRNISSLSPSSSLIKVSELLFSSKTQKEVFNPIVAEWHYEYFEDLKNKRFIKSKLTNLRWTYHFLVAMWQKSPIGDLIEFISKFWK